jgi:predicted nucleic acid-binding protein
MMVLVDTPVWVDHLQSRNAGLDELLERQRVLCHPLVVGEIACGRLDDRRDVLELLRGLQRAGIAENHEVMDMIERQSLFGQGLGWIDMHLLASAILSRSALWTRDKNLHSAAEGLGIPTWSG